MARQFSDLTKHFPAERRERIEAQTVALIQEYELLKMLRVDRDLTQEELAAFMGIRQASVSKLESQRDIRLATLQKYVEALGGQLEIRINFPDRSVTLQQFTTAPVPAAAAP